MRVLHVFTLLLIGTFLTAQTNDNNTLDQLDEHIIHLSDEMPVNGEKTKEVKVSIEDKDGKKHIVIIETNEDGTSDRIEWEGEGEIPAHIKKYVIHPVTGGMVFKTETLPKAFLGVVASNSDDNSDYVIVDEVIEGTTAEEINLQPGDELTMLNGVTVSSVKILIDELKNYEVGDEIDVTIRRNGDKKVLRGLLGERPASYNHAKKIINFNYKTEDGQKDSHLFKWNSDEEHEFEQHGKKYKLHKKMFEGDQIEFEHGEKRIIIIKRKKEEGAKTLHDDVKHGQKTGPDQVSGLKHDLALTDFNAFPNPTGGHLNISFQTKAAPLAVQIVDMNGKMYYKEDLNQFNGNYSRVINFGNAVPGNYILTIRQGDQLYQHQIVYQ